MDRRLAVVELGPIESDPAVAAWLERELPPLVGLQTFAGRRIPLSDRWRDPDSGRYLSNRIVDDLVRALAPGASFTADPRHPRSLAVTDVDLVAPGRPFVFGEATLGGPCALLSLARLRSPDLHLFRRRALTEAAHEIGHLRGLDHCPDPRCVMFPSADLRDTDAKLERLCPACARDPRAPHPP